MKIHLGIIPDGNRRFAQKHGWPEWRGHLYGAKKMEEFLNWCLEYPEIKQISIFALSTENLNRPKEELEKLWEIYRKQLEKLLRSKEVRERGIRIRVFGDPSKWRDDIKDLVKELISSTKMYSKYILNILLAYGFKFELKNAISRLLKNNSGNLERYLFVRQPLDLIIRTGGRHRLSNFLLYQASYAEIWFSRTLWPEFRKEEFKRIMDWFFQQQRNFGR